MTWPPHLILLLPAQARDEYAKGGGLSARASSVNATGCSFVGNAAVAVAEASAGEEKCIGFTSIGFIIVQCCRICRFNQGSTETVIELQSD